MYSRPRPLFLASVLCFLPSLIGCFLTALDAPAAVAGATEPDGACGESAFDVRRGSETLDRAKRLHAIEAG